MNTNSFIDGIECFVTPNKAWEYFNSNFNAFKESMIEIAHNSNNSTSVYITEDDGNPRLCVDVCGEIVDDVICITEQETSEMLRDIYAEYILSNRKHEGYSNEDEIDARENELADAFCQFLETVVDDPSSIYSSSDSESIQGMLDFIIEYIAIDNNYSVYRPTYVEDENGTVEYVEYPYENKSAPPAE